MPRGRAGLSPAAKAVGTGRPPRFGVLAHNTHILEGAGHGALVLFRPPFVAVPDAPRTHKKEKAA
jgi:hypothetical protein